MITVNPPNLHQIHDPFEFVLKRPARFDVAQEHDRCWPLLQHCVNDMLKASMRVAAKKDPPLRLSRLAISGAHCAYLQLFDYCEFYGIGLAVGNRLHQRCPVLWPAEFGWATRNALNPLHVGREISPVERARQGKSIGLGTPRLGGGGCLCMGKAPSIGRAVVRE